MSKIKIEKKAFNPPNGFDKDGYRDFLVSVKEMKVGESFVFKLNAQHRLILSACKVLLDKEFNTYKEGNGSRVFRRS